MVPVWKMKVKVPNTRQGQNHRVIFSQEFDLRQTFELMSIKVMRTFGWTPTEEELKDLVLEIDEDGSGEIEFPEFCQLCATFLVEDPDLETMKKELKDAFRIYDKEGQGFITNDTLRALIGELLAPLTDEELDGIIEELDEDGSGSMDFDEFCEMMMTGKDDGD